MALDIDVNEVRLVASDVHETARSVESNLQAISSQTLPAQLHVEIEALVSAERDLAGRLKGLVDEVAMGARDLADAAEEADQ